MRLYVGILFSLSAFAADPQLLMLETRARTDFDRVAQSSAPQVDYASACVQAQAALLPVAPAAEQPLVHYRKGYCILMGALVGQDPSGLERAAAELDKAAAASTLPPVSSAVPVLAAIARLQNSPDQATLDREEGRLMVAAAKANCNSPVTPEATCRADLALAHLWLGWIDWRGANLIAAAREFTQAPDSAWIEWVAGRQLFERQHYTEAVPHLRAAVERWPAEADRLLWPKPEMGAMLTDLGATQLLAVDPAGAIATLDRAAKLNPDCARILFLRARAKEIAGHEEAADADYRLASRTAFAAAKDLASGEAHLYRGILFYRRKDFSRAEAEFSSALNFEIAPGLRADASAWRRLAAVASGSCAASREDLARALANVSPFFPRREAQAILDACNATAHRLQQQDAM